MMLSSTFNDCTLSVNQVRGCEPKANGCRPGAGLRASNCQWGCSWLWLFLDERISSLPPITYWLHDTPPEALDGESSFSFPFRKLPFPAGTLFLKEETNAFTVFQLQIQPTIHLEVSTFPMTFPKINQPLGMNFCPLAPAPPLLHFPYQLSKLLTYLVFILSALQGTKRKPHWGHG